jgi:Tfp pilus assembly protein PilV
MMQEKDTMTIKSEKRGWVRSARRIHIGEHSASCPNGRWGFTLAEAMMAVVVLGIAAAGLLLPFSIGSQLRCEGVHRTLGARLASHLMEQIVLTPFDQIINYDGYTEAEGQVKDAAGVSLPDLNYARFSREVSCSYVYVPQENGTTQPVFIRVTVSVNWAGKNVATINRLVSE